MVSSRFLFAGMAGLALPAPVPPLALLGGKKGVARLGDGGGENILTADIHVLAGDTTKLVIEPGWILPGKLFDAANAKQIKVAKHGRADRDQVGEGSWIRSHKKPP